jgi:teichuronic acid biosynthesis glycosyltransferase TuaC
MRVLIVTNMYPTANAPSFGIFVQDHVRALTNLGVDLEVFFVNGREARSEYVRALPLLARRLRTGKIEIVHAQHSYCVVQVVLASVFVSRLPPVVFTMHEGEVYLPSGTRDPDADRIKQLVYSKRVKRWAVRFADQLVAVAPGMTDAISLNLPHAVIPPGVDVDRFRPMSQRQCRDALGLPQDTRIVFFPASPSRDFNKGYTVFRQAERFIRAPVHVLTGGGIDPRQMPLYMNASDVVVQASRFEASPMIVKEAMACERPIVSTDVGDVRDLCAGVGGCFICSPDSKDMAEKIEIALSLNGSADGGRARILKRGLTLQDVAERYVHLYHRVVADSSKPRP